MVLSDNSNREFLDFIEFLNKFGYYLFVSSDTIQMYKINIMFSLKVRMQNFLQKS